LPTVLAPFFYRLFWRDEVDTEAAERRFRRLAWLGAALVSLAIWALLIWAVVVWLF